MAHMLANISSIYNVRFCTDSANFHFELGALCIICQAGVIPLLQTECNAIRVSRGTVSPDLAALIGFLDAFYRLSTGQFRVFMMNPPIQPEFSIPGGLPVSLVNPYAAPGDLDWFAPEVFALGVRQ